MHYQNGKLAILNKPVKCESEEDKDETYFSNFSRFKKKRQISSKHSPFEKSSNSPPVKRMGE